MSSSTSPRKVNPRTPLHTRQPDHAQSTPDHFDSSEINSPIHISPSKARANQLLNHDISTITAWLEDLLGVETLPRHLTAWQEEARAQGGNYFLLGTGDVGRNDVLEALKALRSANLKADHLRCLVEDAENEELRRREHDQHGRHQGAAELLHELEDSLTKHDPKGRLNMFSQAAQQLSINEQDFDGSDSHTVENVFIQKMLELSRQRHMLEQQVRELGSMAIFATVGRNNDGSSALNDEHIEGRSEQLRAQTAQFNRDTKQVNLRTIEQEGKLRDLERQVKVRNADIASIQRLVEAKRRIAEKHERLVELKNAH